MTFTLDFGRLSGMNAEEAIFESVVTHGRFDPMVADSIRELLKRMEGKRLRLKISPWTRQRSARQNRYYWGVVIAYIWNMFVENGNDVTREEVHDFMKLTCGKTMLTLEVVDPQGEVHQSIKSSTKLNTKEWEQYMLACREWAARMGLQIPEPNEVMA